LHKAQFLLLLFAINPFLKKCISAMRVHKHMHDILFENA